MKDNYSFLKLPNNIKALDVATILDNLYFYSYHSKYLQKIQKTKIDKEDPHYISTYSSFIGEVYENIIYELLLDYAINNNAITSFVLKGPHQDRYENLKSGLMIDRNDQIVYKAGYKDVTEFDALFFTKDSVWFVESTIVKTTTSLRKRLKKKKALLQILFPKKNVHALIILSKGALGINVFPKYCKVWVTDVLSDEKLINSLMKNNNSGKKFIQKFDKKLHHAKDIKVAMFKYFDTLNYILKSIRKDSENILDFKFLKDEKVLKWFEIFSKFYIGHLNSTSFVEVLKYKEVSLISEDIPLENIQEDQIVVTIEKIKENYELIYYLKINNGKLKKLEVKDNNLIVSNKDPKGFTASEIKYMKFIFKKSYKLNSNEIIKIERSKPKVL
ncbi:MAG: hypothetical protein U9R37_06800 [Campylobacterota bacterium]|nr:hypothetical protein [Campylobacterota bacterium]